MLDEKDFEIRPLVPRACEDCGRPAKFQVSLGVNEYSAMVCGYHVETYKRWFLRCARQRQEVLTQVDREAEERRIASQQVQESAQRELRERIKLTGPSYPLVFGTGVPPEQRQQIMQQLAERG